MQQLEGAKATDFFNAPNRQYFDQMMQKHGEKFTRTLEIFHGFVQEVLGRIKFAGNDQAAQLLRVLRTETKAGVVDIKTGKMGTYLRGVNESGSIFAPVFSGTRTVTTVPHTRITGLYFFERTPGTGQTFFYGDHENEVTFMSYKLKTLNVGKNGNLNLLPGTNHALWEL